MPKFFVYSDAHGFLTPLKKALAEAGWDENNPDHWLVSCGDNFDRGEENLEMLKFLSRVKNKILVRGNHEDLLEEMFKRGFPASHDIGNGTFDSALEFMQDSGDYGVAYMNVRPLLNKMLNYFETERYIFVHGWIAVNCEDDCPKYWQCNRKYIYDCDWRDAHSSAWEQARWRNGMEMAHQGIIEENKTIVCGHWHTTWGKVRYQKSYTASEFGTDADFSPYYDEGIIALDACTAHSGYVNVIVLEDEFLEGEKIYG